jgi:hypothetical protein
MSVEQAQKELDFVVRMDGLVRAMIQAVKGWEDADPTPPPVYSCTFWHRLPSLNGR